MHYKVCAVPLNLPTQWTRSICMYIVHIYMYMYMNVYTVEPPNNGHGGDEHFVHCSEVVPSSEVLPLSTIISLVCESQCIYIII